MHLIRKHGKVHNDPSPVHQQNSLGFFSRLLLGTASVYGGAKLGKYMGWNVRNTQLGVLGASTFAAGVLGNMTYGQSIGQNILTNLGTAASIIGVYAGVSGAANSLWWKAARSSLKPSVLSLLRTRKTNPLLNRLTPHALGLSAAVGSVPVVHHMVSKALSKRVGPMDASLLANISGSMPMQTSQHQMQPEVRDTSADIRMHGRIRSV